MPLTTTIGQVNPPVLSPEGSSEHFDADRLRHTIASRLKPVAQRFTPAELHAVGGGWRSLAQLHMEMSDYPLRIVHQYAMTAGDARDVARFVAQQSRASLDRLPGVSKRRAETLPYAALVLDGLIEALGLRTIVFSAWGLREGLLYETLDRDERPVDPLIAGCAALGGRQGILPGLPAALEAWLDDPFLRTQDYFFVDHDSEAWPTMLALVQPGVIRKTLAIVTAK
jgi:exopolyphosphatase/guanosine-5'-triphosphate,3'-diphosphate pyrophosphatase